VRKIAVWTGSVFIVAELIAGFIAYFVRSFDPITKSLSDGFRRPLTEAPWFMQFIFRTDAEWAGWGWFLADMIIFWGRLGIAVMILQYGLKDSEAGKARVG
jgi:hypothetical protein